MGLVFQFLIVKEIVCNWVYCNEDILTTKEEIESWTSFIDSLSSKEEYRELFVKMLNDCYKYMLLQLTKANQSLMLRKANA